MELEAVAAVAGTIITICIKLNCPGCPVQLCTALTFSQGEREDDNGPGNVPPLPPHYALSGVKLNMETVNNTRGARISPISPILADTKVDSGEIVTRCLRARPRL